MSTRKPAEQQPATSAFLTKWNRQINIALEQKGSGISQYTRLGH